MNQNIKELATVIKCSNWKELHENLIKAEEAGVPMENIFFDPSPLEPFIPSHITVNGVPHCQAPIYQMHKAAGNSSTVMCDSAVACGYGENREEAEADAAKIRLAFPDADIQVVDGPCHSDPWWKTPAGQSALDAENSMWDDQLPTPDPKPDSSPMTAMERLFCLDAALMAVEGVAGLPKHEDLCKHVGETLEKAYPVFHDYLVAQKSAVAKLLVNPQVFGAE